MASLAAAAGRAAALERAGRYERPRAPLVQSDRDFPSTARPMRLAGWSALWTEAKGIMRFRPRPLRRPLIARHPKRHIAYHPARRVFAFQPDAVWLVVGPHRHSFAPTYTAPKTTVVECLGSLLPRQRGLPREKAPPFLEPYFLRQRASVARGTLSATEIARMVRPSARILFAAARSSGTTPRALSFSV